MTTTHTPRPWKVHKPRKDIRTMFGGDTGIEILAELHNPDGTCGGYEIVVGHANCQHEMRILDEANARLIAAAPELLEALERATGPLVNALELLGDYRNGDIEAHNETVKQARAAIAKAKG